MSSPTYPTPPRSEERRVLGHSVARIEDLPLVLGCGAYIGDISFPGQLHMRVVRSAYAHGRIRSIDTTGALAMPGVHAIWTSQDIADVPPIEFRDPAATAIAAYKQHVLATNVVRYVGEPVAVVFGYDAYAAEDAADLVEVDIDPLPVVLDARKSPQEFSPGNDTEATVLSGSFGDVDRAFAEASHIVELELSIGRHTGVPLETRGAIGRLNKASDVLELHGAAKVPHRNRETLARMLGLPLSKLHLYEGHVGGGFGVRGELYPEDILVLVAAKRLGRPVKWIEDRREHLMAVNHSRQQHHKIRAAVAADGRILGIDSEIFHDQGAYVRTAGTRVLARTMIMLPGVYDVGAFRTVGRFRLTNKTPAGTYRAPGRFEGTFVRERMMDVIADRIGMDPVELRRRNLIRPDQMPFTIGYDQPGSEKLALDSGDYPALLDKMLAQLDWHNLKNDIERRRLEGECVGVGFGFFIEESGRGPSDGARASIDADGFVEVVTGGASVGQGFETVMAQITAEALGVDYRKIRVIHGQTDRIAHGIGAHAARATVLTGNAVHVTAMKLRENVLVAAARLMQAKPNDLDIVDGQIIRRNAHNAGGLTLGELSSKLAPGSELVGSDSPGLHAEGWFNTDETVFPYGAHFAQVRVDRDTGKVVVERYLIAYDIGRCINPAMVEGQLVGACVQGIGGALLEEFTYSESGDPLSVTLADYLLPTMSEAPLVECLILEDAPSPRNPLGIKGSGEGGINAVGAAIAGAISDAIGKADSITELPVTPARLHRIIKAMASNPRSV